jgi:Basic region leucine zipper
VAVPDERKDSAYYERRKKNNEAARRSRESRHSKEQTAIDECQAARERNTKIKIQIELLQRDYNEMCRSVYGRIGPAAASRLIAPPPTPPPMHYGYSSLSQTVAPPGNPASYRMLQSMPSFGESVSGRVKVGDGDR